MRRVCAGLYSKSAKHLLRSVDIVEAIYGDTSVELAHELSKTAEASVPHVGVAGM